MPKNSCGNTKPPGKACLTFDRCGTRASREERCLSPHPGPWEARWTHADPAPTLPAAWSGSDNTFTTGMPLDKSRKDISTPKIFPAPFFRAAAELSGADGSKALEMINKMNKTELLRPADICPGPRRNSSVKLQNYHWWLVPTAQSCFRTREMGKKIKVTPISKESFREVKGITNQEA